MIDPPAYKTILVGDNGTPESEHALEVAVSLAQSLRAKVILLGVLPPPSAESQAEGYGLDNPGVLRKQLEAKFERIRQAVQQRGMVIVTEIVEGNPEEMFEQRTDQDSVDLIIVGHREITRVRRWLEGSTSENLVRSAKASVLIVHDDAGQQ
jgi:nucleotide-binding universal stress UspA family protein